MAFRPDQHVVRGEIDNRTRGRVTGRIWFVGRADPIELVLEGNAWRDLAGRRLEFVNRQPVPGDMSLLRAAQSGVIGDCTASRKVKVPDLSEEEFAEYYKARRPFPWHWANSLYLEWFSVANGRVVIESVNYDLQVTDGPTWEMSPDEEIEQRRANAAALEGFMDRLMDAVASQSDAEGGTASVDQGEPKDPPQGEARSETDDDSAPQSPSEAEAEERYAENERLLDRIEARMEREGGPADFERILREELDRIHAERGEPPLDEKDRQELSFESDDDDLPVDEDDADFDREDRKHPLAAAALEFVLWLEEQVTPPDAAPPNLPHEHPITEMRRCSMIAAGKLAGALNGKPWPLAAVHRADSLVRLKRAREHFADARAAAVDCPAALLPDPNKLGEITARLEALTADCDHLIQELRRAIQDDGA